MVTAKGTFAIEKWEQDDPYLKGEGATLTRAHVSKKFTGDLEATSATELMMVNTQQHGSDAYVAIELITGSLNGKAGSFVLRHSAVRSGDESSLAWVIVPDSGTGELRAIRGEGTIDVGADGSHSYTLDYELG